MPAGTGAADFHVRLTPTAARISRHCFTRLSAIATNPQSQTPRSNGAIHCHGPATATMAVGSSGISRNGALKSRAAGDATTDLIGAGACCHWTRLPTAANAAKGTRNLTEGQPQAVAEPRAVAAEAQAQQRDGDGEYRRLPQ